MTGIIIGILGLVVGIIGIVLTIRSFKKKKISFLIENNTIFDEKNIVEKLQVIYDNKSLSGFSNAKILIVNNGQEAISESDISRKEPIKIKVSENYEILNAKVQYSDSNNIVIKKLSSNEVAIEFDFLNPKEGIIVNFLHDGTPFQEIEFLGRIKGVNKFENLNHNNNKRILTVLRAIMGFIMGVLASMLAYYVVFLYTDTLNFISYLLIFIAVLLGPIWLTLLSYIDEKSKKSIYDRFLKKIGVMDKIQAVFR